MEDSEEEMLEELARLSRDLDSLATQLIENSPSDADAGSLLEIGGLTVSARDVLGIRKGTGRGWGLGPDDPYLGPRP